MPDPTPSGTVQTSTASAPPEKPIAYLEQNFNAYMEDLKRLVRIPSVSFPGFPESEVNRSAEAVVALLKERGLENVEILRMPGVHPYVYGERLKAPGKPTLLLYAHHDVQPPGREELWRSPPFEPTERPGPNGQRLYARGSADDKAGIIVHTAAIDSYLRTVGELPVNVKVVIEGEEEIGSAHLPRFLETYRKRLDADVLVLTDTSNFDSGVPSLTVALRGLVECQVEVRALDKTVHSGIWGGPLPDPVQALARMLSGLVDDEGRIAVPGLVEGVRPVSAKEREDFAKVPYDEAEFRKQAGLIPSARLWKSDLSPVVQIWRYPSLTVNAIQASSRKQCGNIICDTAWAKITVRVVPDMDPAKVYAALERHLRSRLPWGLDVKFHSDAANPAWCTDTGHRAFAAAEAALSQGYGKPVLKIGGGGSIPFVKPFADALGGAPALLVGVEDPYTDAHGENESLLISDLRKAIRGQIYLFTEIIRHWASAGEVGGGRRA